MSVEIEEQYWTGQKEWQKYGQEKAEENKKSPRTTRTDLDDDLMFCSDVIARQELITKAFVKRQADLQKSRVLFIREKPEGGLEYKSVRQTNRFMESGYNNSRRRFNALFSGQYAQGVFVTLTTWDKKFKSKEQALRRIFPDFHLFKKQLDEYQKDKLPKSQRKNYKPMQYLACLEFHKNGYPHLHICFIDVKFLAPKPYIKHLWYKYHQSYMVDVVGIRGVSVFAYLMKYFDKLQVLPVELQALMWYGRKRFYNSSRCFYNQVKAKVKSGFVYVACIKKGFEKELPRVFKTMTWTGATLDDALRALEVVLSGAG